MPPHKSEDYKITAVQYYLSKIRISVYGTEKEVSGYTEMLKYIKRDLLNPYLLCFEMLYKAIFL